MASLCCVGIHSLDTEEQSSLQEMLKVGHVVYNIDETYYLF